MIRKFLLTMLLVTSALFAGAQPGNLVWKFAHTGSEADIVCMKSDQLGNSYIAGTFPTPSFQFGGLTVDGITGGQTRNAFMLKLDPTGKPIWLRSVQGDLAGAQITPEKISISERGEMAIILTAQFTASVLLEDMEIPVDTSDVTPILLKVSKTGRLSWSHALRCNSVSIPEIAANDLFIDEMGDVYTTGYFRGESAEIEGEVIPGLGTDAMLFVACIRSDGAIGWFRNTDYDTGGDNGHLIGTKIINTTGSFFYVAGTYQGYMTFYLGADSISNALQTDCFIARYNMEGFPEWSRQLRGDSLDYPEDIKVLNNNDVVVLGLFNSSFLPIDAAVHNSSTGSYNLFLVSYTQDGGYNNSVSIDAQKPMYYTEDRNAYLNVDIYGNIYVCSEFSSTNVFSDGPQLINTDPGTSDIFVTKISSNTFLPYWSVQGSAPGNDYIETLNVGPTGEIFMGGTTFADYSVDDQTMPQNEEGTPYVARIHADGILDYLYFQNNSADNQIYVEAITTDNSGNAYVAGSFSGPTSTVDAIPLDDEPGDLGIFLGKYCYAKSIQGEVVTPAGDAFSDGYVKIYGYTRFQRAPLNDSVDLEPDGSFIFPDVPYCSYILTVVPTDAGTEQYLPTYYPGSEYWEFAEEFAISDQSTQDFFTIVVQERSVFEGESRLSGNLQEEEAKKAEGLKNFDKAKPSKRTKVVVAGSKKEIKSTYQVIDYTETDNEGNFAFSNIEDGNYYVWVDIPGLPCEPVHYVEIDGGAWVSNLDYLATEEYVEGQGFPVYDLLDINTDDPRISVYPNPAIDQLTIRIDDFNRGIADLYDSNGSHQKHLVLQGPVTDMDLTSFEAGNYLLRIMTDDHISFRKISIVR